MIRVLQLGMTDNLGGIETYLVNYYRNINKKEVQFDFVNIYPNKLCFQDELELSGAKVYKVSNYYKHPIKYLKELKQIIQENHYEIVHCNMNSAAMLWPLIGAKLAHTKVIIAHSHNSSSDKGIVKTILHHVNKHFIPMLANQFFACSQTAGNWFFSHRIMNSKSYRTVYNAIDIKKFHFSEEIRKHKREELGINEDTTVIGHVGRFCKQKNHSFLIKVFYEYQKNNKNSILLLIGQGPLLEHIENKVSKLGLSEKVKFMGQRSDVKEWMCAMDVFMLPSLYEGLPVVGVEAQASGLKCYFASCIDEEVKILPSTEYIDLHNICKWTHIDSNSKNTDFERSNERLYDNKFDIKVATTFIQKLYVDFEKG